MEPLDADLLGIEHEAAPPFCLVCGYDLRGLGRGRCPECGHLFAVSEWRKQVAVIKSRIVDAETSLRWVRIAPWAVAVGAASILLMVFPLSDLFLRAVLRLIAFGCGFAGFFLALSVVRLRQLPQWAQARLSRRPNYAAVWAGLVGGVVLMVLAVFAP